MRYSWWQTILILTVIVIGGALALPNALSENTRKLIPTWLPHQVVSLGLDLQGGVQLRLQVGVDEVIRERLESVADTLRTELRSDRVRYRGLSLTDSDVRLQLVDPDDAQRARAVLLRSFSANEIVGEVSPSGLLRAQFTQAERDRIRELAVRQSIAVIQRRIDELGTRNPVIQQQGKDRIILELPGVTDPAYVKSLLGQTARLTFHLIYDEPVLGGALPDGVMTLPGELGSGVGSMNLYRKVELSGERLQDASPSYQDNEPVVSFRLDALGARQFGKLTSQNVGRPLVIVLDNRVISAPQINQPILGGSGVISGGFSTQETFELALLLRTGALPAPLIVVAEHNVGPSLGEESVAQGKAAGIVGLVLVGLIMIIAYGRFGVISVLGLMVNLLLLLGALSLLQASLTLPGIVGAILTIGMAVDANVLIFERVREEMSSGKIPLVALQDAFDRATVSIIDANVTTFIASAIMFALGEGPIKGFAITLSLGIASSLFVSIILLRFISMSLIVWIKPKAWLSRHAMRPVS